MRPGQPLVGIFGVIMPRKGHRYFLEAAARVLRQFPEARFIIVGGTTDAHRKLGALEDVNRWIHEFGLEKAVIQTGYLADASRYMVDCDIVTMPTIPIPEQIGEGFGLVMIESMAQGVATIASDCGAPREVIEHGQNGLLVPPKDAIALADAMIKILSDSDLRHRIAEAGARTVAQRFDARVMAANLEDMYVELCSRSRGAPH